MSDLTQRVERGLAMAREGKLEQARLSLERLAQLHPESALAAGALGTVLGRMGRTQQALHHLQRAVDRAPGNPGLLSNLGQAMADLGRVDDAIAALEKALEIDPGNTPARTNLVSVLLVQNRFLSVAKHAEAGLGYAPADPKLTLGYAAAMRGVGRAAAAADALRAALHRHPTHLLLASNLAFTLNYCGGADAETVKRAHFAYGEMFDLTLAERERPAATPSEGRKLRLGFLSAELMTHPVAFFLEPMLRHLDRERFEVFLYHTSIDEDGMTERLRAHAAAFRRAGEMDVPTLDRTLRADKLDVLIELSGHTACHRLAAMRFRPARVQATWLGYPSTTGVREIDYRIVDSITDPPGEADGRAVEKLVRMDPTFLCYGAPVDAPAPARDGAPGAITFGSFNAMGKLSDGVVALWSRLLQEAPESRLVLKDSAFTEAEVRRFIVERFAAHGVDEGRIETLPKTAGVREHLALYSRVDVALDTFPYNGTTTTCDALYMGVPVVTLAGTLHAGRVGMSLLTNVGLGEWIAADGDAYVRIALQLARDPARLDSLRSTLREKLLASPLCDAEGFAKRFGEAVLGMWEERGAR